jgi:hypothetical protein
MAVILLTDERPRWHFDGAASVNGPIGPTPDSQARNMESEANMCTVPFLREESHPSAFWLGQTLNHETYRRRETVQLILVASEDALPVSDAHGFLVLVVSLSGLLVCLLFGLLSPSSFQLISVPSSQLRVVSSSPLPIVCLWLPLRISWSGLV